MASTDLIQQRTKECRRLAAAARNASDKAFWLELVERWQAVESRSARLHCLRRGPLVGHLQSIAPAEEERRPRVSPGPTRHRKQRSQSRRLR
jgi:hypothetical protein